MKKTTPILLLLVLVAISVFAYNIYESSKDSTSWIEEASPTKENQNFVDRVSSNVDIGDAADEQYAVNDLGVIVPPKPKNTEDFLKKRTFWDKNYEHLRVYFGDNQKAIVQFYKDKDGFKKGETREAKWSVTDKELCLTYNEKPVCQNISVYYTKYGVPGYTDKLLFLSEDSQRVEFELGRQSDGNLIFNTNMIDDLAASMIYLKALEKNLLSGHFDPNTPHISGNINKITQAYLETLFNNVMVAPLGYFHFRKDGTYSSILKGHVFQGKNDEKQLQKYVKNGKWWVINRKYLCFGYGLMPSDTGKKFSFCTLPMDPYNVMVEPVDGFVTHSSNGYTMKHDMTKFIPNQKFEYFEAFEK